jgi:hypothetical protein
MQPDKPLPTWFPSVRNVLLTGTMASLASGATLMWRGHKERRHTLAPLNAPAHWIWGRESLRRHDASLRHTFTGALVHHASSLFWAAFYELLQVRRRTPTAAQVVSDAAVITAVAAVTDLKLVPDRLTPGFEKRLSSGSLFWVYASFAAGLAAGACWRER